MLSIMALSHIDVWFSVSFEYCISIDIMFILEHFLLQLILSHNEC